MGETLGLIKGVYDATTNTVRGILPQDVVGRRVTSIVLSGPKRSTFKLYKGSTVADANQITSTPTAGGGDNTYDSTTDGAPVYIPAATDCLGVWSGGAVGAGAVGTATLRFVV